jgi:hypothetical protein
MSDQQERGGFAAKMNLKNITRGILLVLFFVATSATRLHAQDLDEQYLAIHQLVQQGEAYITMGEPAKAMSRFKQAQTALLKFQRMHPDWNSKMVNYRLQYLEHKISPPPPKGQQAAAPAKPAMKAEAEGAAPAADKQVKLLEAGNEPRAVLRLHPKVADAFSVSFTVTLGIDMQMGQMPGLNMKLPPMKLDIDSKVNEVRPNGDIKYEMVVKDASIGESADALPQVVEALKTSFGAMKGMTGSGLVSAQGIARDVQIKLPNGSDAQTKQALEQMRETFTRMTCPLPAEAVGAGAKWEVKSSLKSQGMTIQQTTTYELVSVEGERATLKGTLVQTAANQKIANPAVPGMKMDLQQMKGQGTGESVIDLNHVLPVEGVSDLNSESQMTMNTGNQQQPMTLKMSVNAKVEGK